MFVLMAFCAAARVNWGLGEDGGVICGDVWGKDEVIGEGDVPESDFISFWFWKMKNPRPARRMATMKTSIGTSSLFTNNRLQQRTTFDN